MYSIRQFRPTLFLTVLLGMSSFALASQSPELFALAVLGVSLNWWLVATGRFKPLPRIVANLITIGCAVFVVVEIRSGTVSPILAIGQFLILLQLVKLFEQRSNRDYAQVLVLSLLLVVAASISTPKLLFGVMLVIYLFLALYVCLLFHLKVETDHARAALGIPDSRLDPTTLRQDQRFLGRSMRKLTGVVAAVAVFTAVAVFLFFPRGSGGLLLQLQMQPGQAMTGFSDQANFQSVAQITQNESIVGYVKLWRNGKPVQGTTTLLLRGLTRNHYSGGAGNSWSWTREVPEVIDFDTEPGAFTNLAPDRTSSDVWKQEISLEPTGTNVIFALPGPMAISISRDQGRIRFSPRDEVIQVADTPQQRIQYTVYSRGSMDAPAVFRKNWIARARNWLSTASDAPAARAQLQDERDIPIEARRDFARKIREFATRAEVSGANANGPLAEQRNPLDARPGELDFEIARNIENYLRTNFTYTLDLTEARRLSANDDPMVAFLYDFKKGHCEYFAGAMVLLCQSLGLEARRVDGFKVVDGYNIVGGYYVVRQSDAHAWVEVRTPTGWETFDPTSGREETVRPATTMWGRVRQFFNYLEFTWGNSVVAYDRENRVNLIRNLDVRLVNSAGAGSAKFAEWKKQGWSWIQRNKPTNYLLFSSHLLSALIWIMGFAAVGAVAGFLWERRKLRKRVRRIGLDNMPAPEAIRLARQLGFYDELTRLLERHRIVRPVHLTPMEFSESISFLPNEAFDSVRRLTRMFYRIRYGGVELTTSQTRRLHRSIDGVSRILEPGGGKAP